MNILFFGKSDELPIEAEPQLRATTMGASFAPINRLYYECPVDHTRKPVVFLDPVMAEPVVCAFGHEMELYREGLR